MPKGYPKNRELTRIKRSIAQKEAWIRIGRISVIPRVLLKNRICPICKKFFRPKHSYNKCCSNKCAGIYKKTGKFKKCIICGQKFWISPSTKNRRCCGRQCADKLWSKTLRNKIKFPMKFYIKGRAFEYKAMEELKKEGYHFVQRSAGSKGVFDVFAMGLKRENDIVKFEAKFIQVKARKDFCGLRDGLSSKEESILIDRVTENNFKFFTQSGTIWKGTPIWTNYIYFEVWIWKMRQGWYKFRLNINNKQWKKIN